MKKRLYPTFNQFVSKVNKILNTYHSKGIIFSTDKKTAKYKERRKLYNKAMKKLYKDYEKQRN